MYRNPILNALCYFGLISGLLAGGQTHTWTIRLTVTPPEAAHE